MPTATETRTVRAQAKWVHTSARKARVVAEHIRGRSVPEARTVLAFTTRAAAREIEKVLASAVANAEANHGLIGDELIVRTAVVDEGPTLKRWRARARGRVARIKRRTCHITVLLEAAAPVVEERPKPRRAKAESETPAEQAPGSEQPAGKTTARKPKASAEKKPKTSGRKT
jgi:large subunit ribosomal protein L22